MVALKEQLRKWDKRWFAVDKGALVYAASAKETEARRSFPITDILEVCKKKGLRLSSELHVISFAQVDAPGQRQKES